MAAPQEQRDQAAVVLPVAEREKIEFVTLSKHHLFQFPNPQSATSDDTHPHEPKEPSRLQQSHHVSLRPTTAVSLDSTPQEPPQQHPQTPQTRPKSAGIYLTTPEPRTNLFLTSYHHPTSHFRLTQFRDRRGTDPNGGVEVVGLQERTSRAAVKRRHTATFPLRIRFCLVLTFILHPNIIPKTRSA